MEQLLYNSLNSRVLALEQEFKKLCVSFGGNTTFLKGEPGDIDQATAAATKQMAAELV